MNKPLRIGLIGAGMVSRHHLIAWAEYMQTRPGWSRSPIPRPTTPHAASTEFAIPTSFASAEADAGRRRTSTPSISPPRASCTPPLVRLAAPTRIAGAVPEAAGAEPAGGDRTRRRGQAPDAADGARELAFSRILSRRRGLAARRAHRQRQAGAAHAADLRRIARTRTAFVRRWSGNRSCAAKSGCWSPRS